MRKWALLLILFAIPLVAQPVDSARIESLEDSIQTLDRRMEKIEEHWVEIKETAQKSETSARWITTVLIGLMGALIVFGIINIWRAEKDLKEISEIRDKATGILDFLKEARDETILELERTRKERERLKDEGKDVGELDRRLMELSQRLDTFQRMGLPLSAEGWFETGYELYRKGKYREALSAYEKAISINPKFASAYNKKASALLRLGRTLKGEEARKKFEEARESAERAVEFSNGTKGCYNLAAALAQLGYPEEALVNLRRYGEVRKTYFPSLYPWRDDDLKRLQEPPYRKRFIEIVGPPPEGVEEPRAKRKAKPKSTKPKKK